MRVTARFSCAFCQFNDPQKPSIQLTRPDGSWKTLEEIEREVIEFTTSRSRYMTRAAVELGIGRSTLYRKIDGK